MNSDEILSGVQVRSLPEAVAERLREAVLAGLLKPGERLIEQKLAGRLGIGQPTLREALKELELQGFVRKAAPNKGTYVTKLNQEDFQKILEVRMALEVVAIGKTAIHWNERASRELGSIVTRMETAAREFDLATFHKNDLHFHRTIWDLTGNEYLGSRWKGWPSVFLRLCCCSGQVERRMSSWRPPSNTGRFLPVCSPATRRLPARLSSKVP